MVVGNKIYKFSNVFILGFGSAKVKLDSIKKFLFVHATVHALELNF